MHVAEDSDQGPTRRPSGRDFWASDTKPAEHMGPSWAFSPVS